MLLAVNMVLVSLLAMTHRDRLCQLIRVLYDLGSHWVTTSTVLAFYGLLILYLLIVVHAPRTTRIPHRKRRSKRLAPYYDHAGKLKGWVREEDEESTTQTWYDTLVPRLSPGPLHGGDMSVVAATPSPSYDNLTIFSLPSWNGFPDGRFQCHFTPQQVEDTSRLALYWVSDKLPGKRGSLDAVTPEKGKLSRFKCAGVIRCTDLGCTVRIAPGSNVARQVQASCNCGAPLHYRSCDVEWSVILYRNGAIFKNGGRHSHSAYTHSISTLTRRGKLQPEVFIARKPIPLTQTDTNHPSGAEDSSEDQHGPQKDVDPGEDDKDEDGDQKDGVDKWDKAQNSDDERALDVDADESEDGLGE
ncbi:hypothetical protein C8R47DRAFT_1136751 [Mycena vitilis]|nr:hypothetical protein C8R47DRAFT_1136751 [Mycena vitilis]